MSSAPSPEASGEPAAGPAAVDPAAAGPAAADPAADSAAEPAPGPVPWLDEAEITTWVRLAAVLELLPAALDAQLRRDAALTHFEYWVLAMLSEAPGRSLRMTQLAGRTNATLPRLSHVVSRLEARDLVRRQPSPDDRRATDVHLTTSGWDAVVAAAPGHVRAVRHLVLDGLTPDQVRGLAATADVMLAKLDPGGGMTASYQRPRLSGGEEYSI